MAQSLHHEFLAKFGTPSHHDKLLDSGEGRYALSQHGDKNSLDKVTSILEKKYDKYGKRNRFDNDDTYDIKSVINVIHRGDVNHQNAITNTYLPDEHDQVGRTLAKSGTDEHRDVLMSHYLHRVRGAVAEYGNDKHREHLMNDNHISVVRSVAQSPKLSLEHAKKLANHHDGSIAIAAVSNVHDNIGKLKIEDLHDLAKHENPSMQRIANREIQDRGKLDKFLDDNKDDPLLKVN
jgi:chaperonin GroEL (HSP60 family)